MPAEPSRPHSPSPFVVATASWIIPGLGYLFLGQRTRGLTIGITIIFLFVFGLLLGGIRILEVPGYNAHGAKMYWQTIEDYSGRMQSTVTSHPETASDSDEGYSRRRIIETQWIFARQPLSEIRSKPWNVPQIMVGPLDLLADWCCIRASAPIDPEDPSKGHIGARSHSRVNELGVLFTAVAGLLNLVAIIDVAHRSAYPEDKA